MIFIYFLGTGRWVKEVTLAYGLPDEPLHKQTRELKRRTFPPALFAMLIAIATASAGEGVRWSDWHWTLHLGLAVATLAINAWAFWVEYRNVAVNADVIDAVMREVDRIRARFRIAEQHGGAATGTRRVQRWRSPVTRGRIGLY